MGTRLGSFIASISALVLCLIAPTSAWAGGTICPGPDTVEGIDVSVWQGSINWPAVKASGKQYAIIRVSDGLYVDTKFAGNWSGAKSAGVIRGVYQFFEPALDPVAQADLLISKIGGSLDANDLPPTLDMEAKGGQTPAVIADHVGKWVARIKEKLGRDPIIYTGKWFWDPYVQSSAFAYLPLWHAQYCSCCPTIANPWKSWKFWQYSSSGKVGGIAGNVDMDKWDGTLAALQTWIGGTPTCTPHCAGNVLVGADCGKGDCGAFAASCVDDNLGPRCVSVFCPAQGTTKTCIPSPNNGKIADCSNGQLSNPGDCGTYGALCSTAASKAAKCISAFCISDPKQKPVAKDVCLPDGLRYSCTAAGDLNKAPCPAGTTCKMVQDSAVCDAPIVGIAVTPDDKGWWSLRSNGVVEPHGNAQNYGDLDVSKLAKPVVGLASSPSGQGYWIAAGDGSVHPFGDAASLGSAPDPLAAGVVGIVRAGSGQGYWLAGSAGAVFSFGTAKSYGDATAIKLAGPIVGIESSSDGLGYWLVGSNGAVFPYGNAPLIGDASTKTLAKPIAGVRRSPKGQGNWLYGQDGSVFAFGDAAVGSSATNVTAPIVGMARHTYGGGYWLVGSDGAVYDFPGACVAQCDGTLLVGEDCKPLDCKAQSASCVADSLPARCVSQYCVAQGESQVCLPDVNGFLHGTCKDGALSEDKCLQGLQWCSKTGAAAGHCVSIYCVNDPDQPSTDHDICQGDGTRWHCDAASGQASPLPCPDGQVCVPGDSAICQDNQALADVTNGTGDAGTGAMGGAGGEDDATSGDGQDQAAEGSDIAQDAGSPLEDGAGGSGSVDGLAADGKGSVTAAGSGSSSNTASGCQTARAADGSGGWAGVLCLLACAVGLGRRNRRVVPSHNR